MDWEQVSSKAAWSKLHIAWVSKWDCSILGHFCLKFVMCIHSLTQCPLTGDLQQEFENNQLTSRYIQHFLFQFFLQFHFRLTPAQIQQQQQQKRGGGNQQGGMPTGLIPPPPRNIPSANPLNPFAQHWLHFSLSWILTPFCFLSCEKLIVNKSAKILN